MASDNNAPVSGLPPDTGSSMPGPGEGESRSDAGRTARGRARSALGAIGTVRRGLGRGGLVRRGAPGADAGGSHVDAADAAQRVDVSADPAGMAGSVAALAEADLEAGERRRVLGRLASQLRARGVSDTFKPTAALRWIADAVGDIVPHLPVRDRDTLRRHFPGMSDDEIAERLVRNATRATAAIGAAGGGVAAIEWVAT